MSGGSEKSGGIENEPCTDRLDVIVNLYDQGQDALLYWTAKILECFERSCHDYGV